MNDWRVSHIVLLLGVVLMIAGVFVPWVTPVVYYSYIGVDQMGATWFNWSPFDFVWNALAPDTSAIYQYAVDNASAVVGASALYMLATMPATVSWGLNQGIATAVQTAAKAHARITPPPTATLIATNDPRSALRAVGSRWGRHREALMISGTREITMIQTKVMV